MFTSYVPGQAVDDAGADAKGDEEEKLPGGARRAVREGEGGRTDGRTDGRENSTHRRQAFEGDENRVDEGDEGDEGFWGGHGILCEIRDSSLVTLRHRRSSGFMAVGEREREREGERER